MPPATDQASESADLPQGDWYIVPPVDGDWRVEATPDGRGGQHLRMVYPDGYSATIFMRADGRLRVRLYLDNRPHPMEIDHQQLHIWFVDE